MIGVWIAYFSLLLPDLWARGLAEEVFAPYDPEGWDRWLCLGLVPTAWLQSHVQTPALTWAAWMAHMSWFALPLGVAMSMSFRHRDRLIEFFAWMLAATWIADVIFVVLPAEPPWRNPEYSRLLLTVGRIHYAARDNNPLAAFPSMHAALPLLIGLFLWHRAPRMRGAAWFSLAMAVVVGVAVVYLGEHWVVDVLAGYALAAGVAWLLLRPRPVAFMERISALSRPPGPIRARPEPVPATGAVPSDQASSGGPAFGLSE